MDASICGLGQAAPNPVLCVMKYFPHELVTRGKEQRWTGVKRRTRQVATMPVEFKLNGRTVVGRADETDHRDGAQATASRSRTSATSAGCAPTATAAPAWSRSRASACSRPRAAAIPKDGHGGHDRQRARADVAEDGARAAALRHAGEAVHAAERAGLTGRSASTSASRASRRAHQPKADLSHPAIAVNLDACIQCTRCVRACREEQVNDVIGYAFRGEHSKIVFDLDDPMGESTCVACGECVQACPTGALMPAREVGLVEVDKKVDSVCPYCGVGCQLTYHVKDNRILYVDGARRPVEPRAAVREGPLRLRLRAPPAAADEAARPQAGRAEDDGLHRRSRSTGRTRSARRPGRRRSISRRTACGRSATGTARGRSPASARPRARTRRPISSRSWCAPASARTTSTTARGCATPRASRR